MSPRRPDSTLLYSPCQSPTRRETDGGVPLTGVFMTTGVQAAPSTAAASAIRNGNMAVAPRQVGSATVPRTRTTPGQVEVAALVRPAPSAVTGEAVRDSPTPRSRSGRDR